LPKEKFSRLEETRAIRARQQAIGRELRRMYDSVILEQVPQEFLELLRQMDAPAKDPQETDSN
jgi:hypothetical protein